MRPISLRPISPVAVLVLLVLAGCKARDHRFCSETGCRDG